MENNNWRPTQSSGGGGEPAVMETGDWRAQLQSDSRQRIVNKIMETLKRHLPFSGQEGLQELRKIAVRFEEKIYSAATSQSDYLRKISMKMLTMETKSQNNLSNSLSSNLAANTSNPASNSMQSQVPNQSQTLPISMPANQPQQRQQMPSQTIQNNMASAGTQNSASLAPAQPPVSGFTQTPISNVSGQNTVGISMSQGLSSNVFSNSQGQQMQGRQQVVAQQQQQQSQNSQHYLYQQHFQQQLLKQKLQQGNTAQSIMPSHLQRQQQQQNLLQPTQLQSSQQPVIQSSSVMQPSIMQSTPVSDIQQNQQSSLQQSSRAMIQHQQSLLRQQQQQSQQSSVITQQQTSMSQQSTLQQQQPPLMGQQPSGNMQQNQLIGQQNQLIGQQNAVGDTQQQQQQRFIGQQNNLSNIQQHQMMAQSRHQQQLSSQNNVSGLSHQQQQHQLLTSQPGNSVMPTGQPSVHLLQQSKVQAQPQTQSAASLLPTQGQQSQQLQQQLMPNIQPQPSQIQQQPNTLQQSMQQRLQPGSLLQQQSAADQHKQTYMSQRALPETSSTSMDSTAETGQAIGGDWQEEIYQKIKAMKEVYLPDLNDMYQRIAFKLQQHESLQQQPNLDQVDKLKAFEAMLKRMMGFLQLPKSNITMNYKDKLGAYEKQILNLINAHRPGRRMPQGQLTTTQMVQQSQQSQSQSAQVQSQENQMNPQLQPVNMRGPVPAMQRDNLSSLQQNMASLQQNSMSTMSTAQQNMVNSVQSNPSLDSGQANSLNSLQQVAAGSLQQNPVSSQPSNINNLSSPNGVNVLQSNINSVHSNSNMLQQQHLKQQQEQHMLQTQQFKHIQQHQMQQQLMQKQQLLQQQQLHQQPKQQLSAQLQPHQLSQIHQVNEMNDMKIRQGMNAKPGVFQPHSVGQRTAYQQLKPGSFPISSPQLQTASPQIPQHSSPQIDQQNLLTSISKAPTPLQSTTPPFVAPSPSTSVAPSPMPGESEKAIFSVSTQLNAGNIGHQQPTAAGAPAQSLAIGTPGISASPLLAEFSGPDGTHANALISVSGNPSVTEQPIERLIKAVKSMSPAALEASVSDIGAVVSMMDRVAGAAPGNGSRAAVGEDLVAMTKCRLQARNYMTQDGNASKKMRRYISAMPLNIASVGSENDSLKQLTTSELESTATSNVKRIRNEVNHALLEEIRQINQRLIDTVVDISYEDVDPTTTEAAAEGGEGTIVKCSYRAVALGPSLKSQYASGQLSQIQPLRLLVPLNYPNCSPVLLDKLPVDVSKEYEDLSVKAKSRFSISLRSLSQPMSLGEIAKTWDNCTRAVIAEYAQQRGGGSFSSKYGTWENCLSAA